MSANNDKIYFKAYRPPKFFETRNKHMRMLTLLGMLLADVSVFAGLAAALEAGERAPDFTLPSTTGEKISLSQFQGQKHVLIQFYKTDFNPV
jgi:hypothetical protein